MKNLYNLIALILFFFMPFTWISCEKLVEVKAPSNEINKNQVFESIQTANAAMAGLYAGLQNNSPLAGDKSGSLIGIYTDELDFYQLLANNGTWELYQNLQIDNNPSVYSYWASAYQLIYNCNAIIEGLRHSVDIPSAERDRMSGEVLLVRSILYFYLQQLYGDIPYAINTDYTVNQSLSKTSATEVLTKLEADLKQASKLLTDQYTNAERIYPNRKVVELMLAKIYLIQKRWTDAEALLQGILQNSMYQFQSDITKVFNKDGQHILWQLKPKNQGDATKEAIHYYFLNSAPNSYAVSKDLVYSFSSTDLRKQNWMSSVYFNQETYYRVDKYKIRVNNTTEYSIIFRLEEVYLLLAEAITQQGKIDNALPYINATRERAGLSTLGVPISKEDLLEEILLENRKEFFAEMGHRFFDLKRFNRLNTLTNKKPNWKSHQRLWPIPQLELLLNSNLMPQNPGY